MERTVGTRAGHFDELKPLVALCRSGDVAAVREWIANGRPINSPLPLDRRRGRLPLQIAVKQGNYGLVGLLLRSGAAIEPDRGHDTPLALAVAARRLDVVQCLIDCGCEPRNVDARDVFDCSDVRITEFLIENGLDVETGRPLAWALAQGNHRALHILKKYRDRFPSFAEQANFALRRHAQEGNAKWIGLLVAVGADPHAPGPAGWADEFEGHVPSESHPTAAELAALFGRFDVLMKKPFAPAAETPRLFRLLRCCCRRGGFEMVRKIVDLGVSLNDQPNGGSSALNWAVDALQWCVPGGLLQKPQRPSLLDPEWKHDGEEARGLLKTIFYLAKHHARWEPDVRELKVQRKILLELTPDYAVEFLWIMHRFAAGRKENAEALVRSPPMKVHLRKLAGRVDEILATWPPATAGTSPGRLPSEVSESRDEAPD